MAKDNLAERATAFFFEVIKPHAIPVGSCTDKFPYKADSMEPSLYTRTEGVPHPAWVNWFSKKFGVTLAMAQLVANDLYVYLQAETTGRPEREGSPQVNVVGGDGVSMAFVLDCSRRNRISLVEAYGVGYDFLKLVDGKGPGPVWYNLPGKSSWNWG